MGNQPFDKDYTVKTMDDIEQLADQISDSFIGKQFPNIVPDNVEVVVSMREPEFHKLLSMVHIFRTVGLRKVGASNSEIEKIIYRTNSGLQITVVNIDYKQTGPAIKPECELMESTKVLLDKPPRRPCEYCGKGHLDYACDEQIAHLKRTYNITD